MWPYAVSADERIQEFDYDDVLYNSQSEFQKITIMHSKSNGNVLLLDGDLSKCIQLSCNYTDILVLALSRAHILIRRKRKKRSDITQKLMRIVS